MFFITRKAHFNAAHRLHNPNKSDDWNKQMFGKCNSENWHGHNYIISATVAGKPNDDTGFIIDVADLKSILHSTIVEKCDHKNLNLDVPFLDGIFPTTENLAKVFFDQLESPVDKQTDEHGFLYDVKLQETERNSARYCPYLLK